MHLWLIRHGDCPSESAPGASTPDGALSPMGEQQARQTARRLAGERVTHVLSSPLVRALATASFIAGAAGDLPVQVWTELREGYSDMPGRPVPIHRGHGRAELLRRFPRAILPPDIADDGWDHGGDTYASFLARCQDAARMLGTQFESQARVVIVAHGGSLNYLLHALLGISAATPTWFQMEHCAISAVRLVPEEKQRWGWPLYPAVGVEVLGLNDVSHLRTAAC